MFGGMSNTSKQSYLMDMKENEIVACVQIQAKDIDRLYCNQMIMYDERHFCFGCKFVHVFNGES
jgi:hypothetical protein